MAGPHPRTHTTKRIYTPKLIPAAEIVRIVLQEVVLGMSNHEQPEEKNPQSHGFVEVTHRHTICGNRLAEF
jgi:hypothetical protein